MLYQIKNGFRRFVVSVGLCIVFVSSLALADDCSQSLTAESCACQSGVRSEREQVRTSDKRSLQNPSRTHDVAKTRAVRSARRRNTRNDKTVVER